MKSFDLSITIIITAAILAYNARKAIIYRIFKKSLGDGKKRGSGSLSIKISGYYSDGEAFCEYHDNLKDAQTTLDTIALIEEMSGVDV